MTLNLLDKLTQAKWGGKRVGSPRFLRREQIMGFRGVKKG
jgi:hypothetical protein